MPDTQLLAIFVLAMIAGVILFRLYTVLGRRTGHEPPPPQPGRLPGSDALAPPPAAETAKDPGGHGLIDIQLADRSFDTQQFLQGARTAYTLILGAFHAGDRQALRPLLSDEVFAAFDSAIIARGSASAVSLADLKDARIVGASLNAGLAEITVAFTAGFSDGKDVTDVWTFARRTGDKNPNWTLTATSGELPE